MIETKLLPCPFCGGRAEIKWEDWKEISPTSGTYKLSVNHERDCMFVQMNGTNYKSEMISSDIEKLAETWNTRVPMERIVERLEDVRLRAVENVCPQNAEIECYSIYCETCYMDKAIEIVKEEGGLND